MLLGGTKTNRQVGRPGGTRVLAILKNVGPQGEEHAVEIKRINSDGSINYYDPTAGYTTTGYNGNVTFMFSIK